MSLFLSQNNRRAGCLKRAGELAVISRASSSGSSIRKRKSRGILGSGLLFTGAVLALVLHAGSVSPSVNDYFPFRLLKAKDTQAVIQLTDLVNRISSYENKLQRRSAQLDRILVAVTELDIEPIYAEGDPEAEIDVGGGDDFRSPLYRNYGSAVDGSHGVNEILVSEKLTRQLDFLATVPIGYPVEGRISSGFGQRRSPFTRRWHQHRGIDVAVDWYTPVVATADGVVVHASRKGGYGIKVVIDHGNGIETVYAHLGQAQVAVGERVCRGQRIALAGSTGHSTGPHLHYEVHVDGEHRDPADFMHLAKYLKYLPPLS